MAEDKFLNIIQIGVYPVNTNIIKGGVEASVYGLSAGLSKHTNVKVKVITFPLKLITEDYKEFTLNTEIVYLSNPFKFNFISFFRLPKIIKESNNFKPSVIHIHGTNPIVLFLALYFFLKKIDFIITIHGILSVEEHQIYKRKKKIVSLIKYLLYSFFEFCVIWLSPKIIVGTTYVKDWVLKHKLFSHKKVYVIPQGINKKFYSLTDNYKENVILSIGAITERKGYEYAIKAIKILVNKHPDLRYYIIGFCENENYFEKLNILIKDFNLQNNVTLLKNAGTSTMDSFLSEANIFILHSEEESQGIVLSEAMAAGKPVVATDVGGIPYIIKNGINGFLSPFKNIEQFAENIERLLENNNLREKISEENKKEALKYDWDNIANAILSVYKSNN